MPTREEAAAVMEQGVAAPGIHGQVPLGMVEEGDPRGGGG
jgi:hypothetical protein